MAFVWAVVGDTRPNPAEAAGRPVGGEDATAAHLVLLDRRLRGIDNALEEIERDRADAARRIAETTPPPGDVAHLISGLVPDADPLVEARALARLARAAWRHEPALRPPGLTRDHLDELLNSYLARVAGAYDHAGYSGFGRRSAALRDVALGLRMEMLRLPATSLTGLAAKLRVVDRSLEGASAGDDFAAKLIHQTLRDAEALAGG